MERRFPPTPRRLARARARGQVARSPELSSGIAWLAALLALAAGGAYLGGELLRVMHDGLARAVRGDGDLGDAGRALAMAAKLALPVVGVAALATMVIGAAQTGGLFALGALRPRLGFQMRLSAGEAVAQLGKLVVLAGLCVWTLAPLVPALPRLAGATPPRIVGVVALLAGQLALRGGLAYVALGVVDLLRRRLAWLAELKMTRAELERERRENEGDERHEEERARLRRELDVPIFDERALLVAGDDVSVLVFFDEKTMFTPTVTAHGERILARRLRDRAEAAHVMATWDPPLARALPRAGEIPAELYDPIAALVRARPRL